MGIIARLVRMIIRQCDNPRNKTLGHGPDAAISRDWLQSIRSLANADQLSRCAVIVPVSAVAASTRTSAWFSSASRARLAADAARQRKACSPRGY
jgi:hypothetical protein